ncbi:MAG TPA: type 4a pilus biogenesis protein PilO [Gemmatimonadales bacterium]|nr:type 4a pilus biogenesis protein PilO [Gemmatimonadales bacterium]
MATTSRTTPLLVALLAGLAVYACYTGAGIEMLGFNGLQARRARVQAMRDTIATFEAQIDSAKQELAKGTAEDLRQRVETYRASLLLLRRLVPERSEVPNLLDAISSRARIRGVTLAQVTPLPQEAGPVPFATQKYGMAVIGRYDQIGQFMADVASLPRIIVPTAVQVGPADKAKSKALGDTTGAMLQAAFQVRTYVKSDTAGGPAQ